MTKHICRLCLLLSVLLFALFPDKTFAHASIIRSSPGVNEVLPKPPSAVKIQFNEPVQAGFHSLKVLDSSGKQVNLTNAQVNSHNDAILEAHFKKKLSRGAYSLQWKAVSADGHPVEGVIPFAVGTGGEQTPKINEKRNDYFPRIDLIMLRGLLYLSFSLFIGVIIFNLFFNKFEGRETLKKIHTKSMAVLWFSLSGMVISIVLSLPMQTTLYAGVSWAKVFNASLLKDTISQTDFGLYWIFELLFLVLLILVTYIAAGNGFTKKSWLIPIVIYIALLLSKASTGHAAASEHRVITVAMDFIHLLAASIWIGGLFALLLLLPGIRSQKNESERQLYWNSIRTFSLWAALSVASIIITGIYGSLLYVPTFYSLLHTYYGYALLGKILLFVIMLILGSVHFFQGRKQGKNGIAYSIWIELLTGAAILIIAAVLTNLPAAVSSPGPFSQIKEHGKYEVSLHISPNVEGENSFNIAINTKDGKPAVQIEQVILTFTHTKMNMGESSMAVPRISPGKYQTKSMYMNMPGEWKVAVHVLTKSLESFDVQFDTFTGTQ
ncbi:copper resistance protein CopC [Bacillus sp. MUM 13]|uniref:copper resistance protein CopC n=1 Tax=Bacillus sp. MUM 13 TaxID=1678001 RepID=UPI0008F59004|nr:copper resistance protein CopC [Bacillus sp. MUM 13]OIK11856.1 hypothetical protein BIV59_10940 [Bacillus sp. MUM 13]